MSKKASFAALAAVLVMAIATLGFGADTSVVRAQSAEPVAVSYEFSGLVTAYTPGVQFTLDGNLNIQLTSESFVSSLVAVGGQVTVVAHVEDSGFVADLVFPAEGTPGAAVPVLSLASIGCVDGAVGVHFVLLNVPANVTPGPLTFTYGMGLTPVQVGSVWHYNTTLTNGPYAITGATVTVAGVVISYENATAVEVDYDCVATPEPIETPTDEPTLAADCGSGNEHPVAARLADAFDVPYAEIMNWHCMGIGFGEIARAYALQDITGEDEEPLFVEDLFARRLAGEGWGNIVKDSGVAPNELAPGQVRRLDGDETPDDEEEMEQEEIGSDTRTGPGNSSNAPGQNKDNRGDRGNNSNRNNNNRGGRNRR